MKRILLAEDDRNLSRSIDILLTLEGYQVISVYNGEEALNKLLKQKYDMLITDIVMPNMNGIELVKKIRLVNPQIPILIVSGRLNDALIAELERLNVTRILAKPIKPNEFRKTVEEIVANYV
ncbi:MAG TPA: response regulator, partial [Calditrichae bacterium]|nr:response regulator [Calditrichia bacterium]